MLGHFERHSIVAYGSSVCRSKVLIFNRIMVPYEQQRHFWANVSKSLSYINSLNLSCLKTSRKFQAGNMMNHTRERKNVFYGISTIVNF